MRKLYRGLAIFSILLSIIFLSIPSSALHIPDIKSPTIIYTVRHSELRLGVSFELYQIGSYSIELPVANNYIGISINKQWVPLLEIVIMSGFTIGIDTNRWQVDGGIIVYSMIIF